MQLPLDHVRRSFPGLEGDELLLDNAGGSQTLGAVIDGVVDYLRACNVQHGADYARSREAVRRVDLGKRAIASLFGDAPGPVILGPSTTQIVFNLAAALAPGLFVDGVAFAPHAPVDVAALGVDGYVFSLYKVYGPHLAACWLDPDFFAGLANINHDFLADAGAYRLEPGGVCYELVAACAAIPAYLDALGRRLDPTAGDPRARAWAAIAAHEAALSARLLDFLRACPRVCVVGETCPDRHVRVPTISFTVDGLHASEVPTLPGARGVGIRWGDFYARGLVDALGLRARGGVVRASLVHYNTEGEVDRLIAALAPVVA